MIKLAIRSRYLSLLALTGLIAFGSSTLKATSPQATPLKNTHTTSQQKVVGDARDFAVKPCVTNATGETIEFHYDLLWDSYQDKWHQCGKNHKVQGPNQKANVILENNKTICANDYTNMDYNRACSYNPTWAPRINIYVCPHGSTDCIQVGNGTYGLDLDDQAPHYTIIKGRYKFQPYELK